MNLMASLEMAYQFPGIKAQGRDSRRNHLPITKEYPNSCKWDTFPFLFWHYQPSFSLWPADIHIVCKRTTGAFSGKLLLL